MILRGVKALTLVYVWFFKKRNDMKRILLLAVCSYTDNPAAGGKYGYRPKAMNQSLKEFSDRFNLNVKLYWNSKISHWNKQYKNYFWRWECLIKCTTNKQKNSRQWYRGITTLGITVTMLSLIVLIPVGRLWWFPALKLGPARVWSLITKPTVRACIATSMGC